MKKSKLSFKLDPLQLLAAMLCLTVLTIACTSYVYGRFTTKQQSSDGAQVAAFRPKVTYNEVWNESMILTATGESSEMPFSISNIESETTVRITLEVETESVLPYELELYLFDELMTPDSVSEGIYTYTGLMEPDQSAELRLAVKWPDGDYDERFNRLTNRITATLTCEQVD